MSKNNNTVNMKDKHRIKTLLTAHYSLFIVLLIAHCSLLILSCTRNPSNNNLNEVSDNENLIDFSHTGAVPSAVLQTGSHPLWFQLTEDGVTLLETIEDAIYSSALVPWPHTLHIHSLYEKANEIVMAINRSGFLKFSSYDDDRITMYQFSGGEYWREYTIGGFIFYEDNPVVLLYLDDRFLDSNSYIPHFRTWSFNMNSNNPFLIKIPALELFPAEDGWQADVLRLGSDGFMYYRVAKRNVSDQAIKMFRSANLSQAGEEISVDTFHNSAMRKTEPSYPHLPPLPENFVYTAIGLIGSNLIAAWEEQEEYNIGAAGFVVIREN